MYSTCLHCHRSLGRNEVIEHFTVGRRLAFDPAKGRLWVVCTACRRWNLTPLEERWEAIEECERLYRGTRLRASTDNIGLARVANGMELVRIGAPRRPELAAWRYAGAFGRRWMSRGLPIAALAGGVHGLNAGLRLADPVQFAVLGGIAASVFLLQLRLPRPRIALPDGKVARLGLRRLRTVHLEATGDGWALRLGHHDDSESIVGMPAERALRTIMTARNFLGGPKNDVDMALDVLVGVGDPDAFIRRLARASQLTGIRAFPPEISMALEMALHEGTERRAFEGELNLLNGEWALAEEIAAIADNLFLPESVREKHRQLIEGVS